MKLSRVNKVKEGEDGWGWADLRCVYDARTGWWSVLLVCWRLLYRWY